ncbi:hypothetical protein CI15_06425 [Paraburkholderia monticola]|uniref:Uncharacterized protein n=1 Tax=Paraburkholderia monticola TaxID=1399968 RepID=A0A149PXN6_9BURK|nr:hypothetical protein [Paraburkholderia monticola]KXU89818.1 hypothetical protein CI15_06425 [Paraburkholderia monticola]
MFELNEQAIAAWELRSAAYHEAAHKLVYERFGGAGEAQVWKNESGHPGERAWLGQFRPLACPEQLRTAAQAFGHTVIGLPPKWKELVGVAGLVAEEMLRGDADDVDEIVEALLNVISEGAASTSDLKLMGITDIVNGELSYEVVEEAVRILRDGWQIVREEAQYLIESCSG